jgi:DNA polymerase family A
VRCAGRLPRVVTCIEKWPPGSPASRSTWSRPSNAGPSKQSCSGRSMAPASRLTGDCLANFGVDLSLVEAGASKEALFAAYPAIREYQQDQVDRARQDGVLWSVTGRLLRARREKGGQIRYTVAVNYAVQASAADVLLDAVANVQRALPGSMILTVHDELVLEVERTGPRRPPRSCPPLWAQPSRSCSRAHRSTAWSRPGSRSAGHTRSDPPRARSAPTMPPLWLAARSLGRRPLAARRADRRARNRFTHAVRRMR